MAIIVAGTGSYVPERVLTNHDLEKMVDTSHDWIVTRTGIHERRVAAKDQASSDMATEAARRAMDDAGISADEIDFIVLATCTPDMAFPNTASIVQERLGARRAFCMDIGAACSGFIYGIEVATKMMKGGYGTCLVVGAEKMTNLLDWDDRATCVLFGDGAGAVVLRHSDGEGGIGSSILGSDGALGDLLNVPAGGSRQPVDDEVLAERLHTVKMSGREVFKHAVTNMVGTALSLVEEAGWSADDLDLVIPHQANKRIVDAIRNKLDLPEEKMFVNLDKYGNTSAASVGIALDEAVRAGRIQEGAKVLLVAFGAGFTWGGMLMEWRKT